MTIPEICEWTDGTGSEYSEIFFSATYAGSMGEVEGVLQSHELINIEFHTTCPSTKSGAPVQLPQVLDIRVDGETMTGTSRGAAEANPYSNIFTATKQ